MEKVKKQPRLKTLMYGGEGSGKTHFCCSFPDAFYIDTEGVEDYPHFTDMIEEGGGKIFYASDIEEIIKKVSWLISTKHNYKTLVIDSISFPYAWLAQMEAERLSNPAKGTEGTEFGANLAKAKRLTFHLGIMLSRLDMNVIVIAHERTKYEKKEEVGQTYDITDKMAYSLGAVWNLKRMGETVKLFVKKSRYPEMKIGSILDFNNGYETIKNIFGEAVFKRESVEKELASNDQIMEFQRLIKVLNISDERVNKFITNAKAVHLGEIEKDHMQSIINKLHKNLQGDAA